MPYLSEVVLVGYVGQVSLKERKTRLTLAVTPEKDNTNWYTVFVSQSFPNIRKGQLVLVIGKLVQRKKRTPWIMLFLPPK